ncbi:hypothetical protein D3C71_2227650 [compost metagenome]
MSGGFVDDIEAQGELLLHLLLPLGTQCRRCNDQHPADTTLTDQLSQNQTGFDGFTQTHIIGQQ